MADRFVRKDGSDANPGTSTSPVKTIGRAITISSSGDTIHVGAGIYIESIFIPNNKNLVITSDGNYVVLDGIGLLSFGCRIGNIGGTLQGFVVRNYTKSLVESSRVGFDPSGVFDRCFLDGTTLAPSGLAYIFDRPSAVLSNSVIVRCARAIDIREAGGTDHSIVIRNSTIFKPTVACLDHRSGLSFRVNVNNTNFVVDGGAVVYKSIRALGTGTNTFNMAGSTDFNNYELRGGANHSILDGVTRSTFAVWKSAISPFDQNSKSVASGFIDEDRFLLMPDKSLPSALIGAGFPTGTPPAATNIGAYGAALGLTKTSLAFVNGSSPDGGAKFDVATQKVVLKDGFTVGTWVTDNLALPGVILDGKALFLPDEGNVNNPGLIETVDRVRDDQIRDIEFSVNGGTFQTYSYGLNNTLSSGGVAVNTLQFRFTLRRDGLI